MKRLKINLGIECMVAFIFVEILKIILRKSGKIILCIFIPNKSFLGLILANGELKII